MRGVIEGLECTDATLLERGGRAVGLGAASASASASATASPFVAAALAATVVPSSDDGCPTLYREGVADRDARDGERSGGAEGEDVLFEEELLELVEVFRAIPGSLGVVAPRTMEKEVIMFARYKERGMTRKRTHER